MRTLLLVRNGVSHDARVLRAARVAEGTVGGGTLVVGVATASARAGETTVEGVRVLRLSTRRHTAPADADDGVRAVSPSRSVSPPPRSPGRRTPSDPPTRLGARARVKRTFSGAAFAWRALGVARRERPALVHANDWNTMWCGVAIKLVCRARLVYDSHELWADRNGRWEWRPWVMASEALFVRVADTVVTASPGYADALATRYRTGRPAVIRNIPESRNTPESPSTPAASVHGASETRNGHAAPKAIDNGHAASPRGGCSLVVYVGGLMPGRGLEQTIDALALAPAIRLRAVGPGTPAYRAQLIERASRAGVEDRVELAPPVAPGAVGALLESATAGLCLIQPVCRSYELTLPNKLFEYAAAGVPVLASDLPVIAALVRGDGLGEVVAPGDPRGIAIGLERLVEPERRAEAARRSRAFAGANDWGRESRKLAALYSQVLFAGAREGRA